MTFGTLMIVGRSIPLGRSILLRQLTLLRRLMLLERLTTLGGVIGKVNVVSGHTIVRSVNANFTISNMVNTRF